MREVTPPPSAAELPRTVVRTSVASGAGAPPWTDQFPPPANPASLSLTVLSMRVTPLCASIPPPLPVYAVRAHGAAGQRKGPRYPTRYRRHRPRTHPFTGAVVAHRAVRDRRAALFHASALAHGGAVPAHRCSAREWFCPVLMPPPLSLTGGVPVDDPRVGECYEAAPRRRLPRRRSRCCEPSRRTASAFREIQDLAATVLNMLPLCPACTVSPLEVDRAVSKVSCCGGHGRR